jgi:serine protease Do
VKVGRLEEEAKQPPAAGAKPEKDEDQQEKPRKRSSLGLTFAAMSDELRSRYSIEKTVEGVVITEVDPESPVAESEVKPGDVVIEVTHEKVKSPSELDARLDELRKLKRKSALLLLADHQGEMNFVTVAIGD